MQLIVGLGNPGKKFKNTPHNVGFETLDLFKKQGEFSAWRERKKLKAKISEGKDLILAKPQTFVNESGRAVKAIIDYYKIALSDLWVIQDDLNLEIGKLRIKKNSRSGGHKGIESIIKELKTQNFKRIKIGVGPKPEKMLAKDYVLKRLKKQKALSTAKKQAVELLKHELSNS